MMEGVGQAEVSAARMKQRKWLCLHIGDDHKSMQHTTGQCTLPQRQQQQQQGQQEETLVILKQAEQRKTHLLSFLMSMPLGATRRRPICRITFCMAKSAVTLATDDC